MAAGLLGERRIDGRRWEDLGAPPLSEAKVVDLIRRASEDVSRLVQDEIQLAKVELTEKARNAGAGVGMFSGAAVLAWFGVGTLVASAVLALALVLPAWAAALIVAVVLFALAAALVFMGKARLKRAAPPVPTEAMDSIRADVDRVKAGVHR
jgi:uncharacterized membrane protein YqjE